MPPPSEYRPAAPVIRSRPAPQPEPEETFDAFDEQVAHEQAPQPQPVAEPAKDRSFASLFGWKAKPADDNVVDAEFKEVKK